MAIRSYNPRHLDGLQKDEYPLASNVLYNRKEAAKYAALCRIHGYNARVVKRTATHYMVYVKYNPEKAKLTQEQVLGWSKKKDDEKVEEVKEDYYKLPFKDRPYEKQLDELKYSGHLIRFIPTEKQTEEMQLAAVQNNPLNIKHIANPTMKVITKAVERFSEEKDRWQNENETIKNTEWIDFALMLPKNMGNDPAKEILKHVYASKIETFLQHLEKPSATLIKSAIEKDPTYIEYVKNPSKELQEAAVSRDGDAIRYIKNPSEDLKLKAVKRDGGAIRYIDKPSQQLINTALENAGNYDDFTEIFKKKKIKLTDEQKIKLLKSSPRQLRNFDFEDFNDKFVSAALDSPKKDSYDTREAIQQKTLQKAWETGQVKKETILKYAKLYPVQALYKFHYIPAGTKEKIQAKLAPEDRSYYWHSELTYDDYELMAPEVLDYIYEKKKAGKLDMWDIREVYSEKSIPKKYWTQKLQNQVIDIYGKKAKEYIPKDVLTEESEIEIDILKQQYDLE